jgi:hypothetical protein
MSKKGKIPAPKSTSNPDFDAVCLWYRMEFANYSFEVARDIIGSILERKFDDRSPEYYAMTVGVICNYARPFTNNKPVGKLADDIVPVQLKSLHSHASPRVRVVASPTRDRMRVAVHHGLPRDFSTVDSYVELRHGGIRFANHGTRFGKQPVAGT